jgi:aldose 1-epimerase
VLSSLRVGRAELLVPPTDVWRPYPRWGSFVMAPWVGPIADARLTFRGRTYDLVPNEGAHAVHGLVAGIQWDVTHAAADAVSLVRGLDGLWPFGGEVHQHLRLRPDGIELTVEVRATDRAMPVSAGFHPWFSRGSGDVVVGVLADRHLVHDGPLPTGEIAPVDGAVDLREAPSLGDRRIDAVYVDTSTPALLRTSDVRLSVDADPDSAVTVVYTPPEAVCVERWSAWPDAHRFHDAGHPTGLAVVEAGETFRRWTRWTWGTAET